MAPTTLRFRLMLLVVTAVLPIFGLMLYQASCEQDRKLRESGDEAMRLATVAAGSVSQATVGARQMLMALVCTEPIRKMNAEAASSLFADLLKYSKEYLNVGLVAADGLIVASGLPLSSPVYLNDRRWFRQLSETRNLSVSEYLVGRVTGKPSVNLGLPLHPTPENPFPGAVYAALDLKMLQRSIEGIHLPADAVILVVERNGTCLAHNPNPERVGLISHSWTAFQKQGALLDSPVAAAGLDGTLRNYYYAAVPGTEGLMVAVGISKAAAMAESKAEFWRNLSILVFWTAASLAAAAVVGQVSVLKHIRHLSETAQRLAAHDWTATAAVSGGARELQQLARTFDAMSAALRQQNDALEGQVRQRTYELVSANASLKEALAEVKQLHGLLPICSGCKKIRDDQGYWSQIELYITAHSGAQFSHSLCPDCARTYFPELDLDLDEPCPPPPKPQSP